MSSYVIVTESGSDIHEQTARRHGLTIVPMHVNFGDESREDDSFPSEELFEHYRATGRLPQTAGCSPQDFIDAFDAIHGAQPSAHIIYLAYSAATTISFKSAHLAAEGRDYITMIDTKAVSGGLRLIVTNLARQIELEPDMPLEQVKGFVADQVKRLRFVFIPGDLDYLRAGGRLSNIAFLGATLLRIKPVVEVVDGRLVATKKRRGPMLKCVGQTVEELLGREELDLSRVNLTYTEGDEPDRVTRVLVETLLRRAGVQEVEWVKSGCVIASHAGPGAFGMAVLAARAD